MEIKFTHDKSLKGLDLKLCQYTARQFFLALDLFLSVPKSCIRNYGPLILAITSIMGYYDITFLRTD